MLGPPVISDLDEKVLPVTTTPARDTSSLRIRVEVYDASVTLFINENRRYGQQIFWLLCGPVANFVTKIHL